MLLDGVFSELAIFDRTQPEGLALATYLTAVSALANTIVVPGHAAAQRRLKWKSRTWVGAAVYASVAAAVTLALFWDYSVGGASLALCFRRADISLMNRGDAAAGTWIFRGDPATANCIFRRRVAATPRPRRG